MTSYIYTSALMHIKTSISILSICCLFSCSNAGTATDQHGQTDTAKLTGKTNSRILPGTIVAAQPNQVKQTVLVLPPHDAIANEGISPGIQKYLEQIISGDSTVKLIRFPYRQLMHVPYQNVFDKQFCRPVTDKVKADLIIMSKIEQSLRTGNMSSDKWNLAIKFYNPNTGTQVNSVLTANNMTANEIENLLLKKRQILFTEIRDNR